MVRLTVRVKVRVSCRDGHAVHVDHMHMRIHEYRCAYADP